MLLDADIGDAELRGQTAVNRAGDAAARGSVPACGSRSVFLRDTLDHDALDLVDGDRVGRPVVELRRLRRRVPGDPLRVLKASPVRQIRRDPRRPERVAAGQGRQVRARRLIMARTRRRDSALPVRLRPAGSTLWKSAALPDGVGGSQAASVAQRVPLPPANPWPASPASTPVAPTLASHAVRVRERQDGSSDYTTTRGGWERKELRMKDVIALLNDQRSELLDSVARIDAAIVALGVKPRPSAPSRQPAKRRRREMSAETKKAVSDRMKNYWAGRRKQAGTTGSGDAENADDAPTEA